MRAYLAVTRAVAVALGVTTCAHLWYATWWEPAIAAGATVGSAAWWVSGRVVRP